MSEYADRRLPTFADRHIGPSQADVQAMLEELGVPSLDQLVDQTVPAPIRLGRSLALGAGKSEHQALADIRAIATQNEMRRSFIGLGYYNTLTPPIIQRNILENPGWYTQYTPYQAEIAQGRLEALLNFQTMVCDLTGLPLANASLLDEGTAAAEAMGMAFRAYRGKSTRFFVSKYCHPHTIAVLQTRAEPLHITLVVGDESQTDFHSEDVFGAIVQYPRTDGAIVDYRPICQAIHQAGATVVVAADLLSLSLLCPPGEWGADIAVGSTQRFGVPVGFGGPHAAFMATTDDFKRQLPGRLIGVSQDATGNQALRMALQTREQHIRRDRATSNICTSQVLLAIIASMYAVYHGPQGIAAIAERIRRYTVALRTALRELGYGVSEGPVFDTLTIALTEERKRWLIQACAKAGVNLRIDREDSVGISLDEAVTRSDVETLVHLFADDRPLPFDLGQLIEGANEPLAPPYARTSEFLTHPIFNRYHSEHELLRYIHRLQSKDLSLITSMIPLGSCTMKLNATAEMVPITWPEFATLHPFVPPEQARGYATVFHRLESALSEITGFPGVSLQPNAGSQGEYAGLLVIRAFHQARGESKREVCLIPVSAHGTNAASAVMAGMKVVAIKCDDNGNIDLDDLAVQAERHADVLAALMITYPSTDGVFERDVLRACRLVHAHGGQVYMDGANMNAQVGLCRPADIGADVCHLNLHKTFCIP
ncbi:MAG: aminomethyl-transferring glycine dehydrogenase, partial [Myxococcales bacterium]|nr:aminomethyl-transferring glycine dehydrogenase [Myxococcales bacterium]